MWEFCNLRVNSTRKYYIASNRLFLLWDATDNAALHHEEDTMMAEIKSMNTSAVRIAHGITNHPHVAMRGTGKNMTQNAANEVETEVGGAVVTARTDVERAKGAIQCIFKLNSYLPTL
jgi:hypothetical protein